MSIFDTSEFNNSPFDIMLNYPKGYNNHIQPGRFDPFQTPSSDLLRKESLSMIDKLQSQQYTNINRSYNIPSNNSFNVNVNGHSPLNGISNNNVLNTNLSNGLSNGGTPTSLSNGNVVSNGLSAGIPRPPNKHFPSWSSGETSQNSFQYMAQSPPVTTQNHTFQPTTTQNSNHMHGSLHSLSTSPLNGYSSPLFGESPNLSSLSSKSRLNSYINSSPPSSLPAAGLIPQIESMKVSDFLNNSMPTRAPEQQEAHSFDANSRTTPPNVYEEEAEEEEDLFTTFLTGSLNDFSPPMNDYSELNSYVPPSASKVEAPAESINVWDYMSNIRSTSPSSSESNSTRKNAWAKPLKFQEPSKTEPVEHAVTPRENHLISASQSQTISSYSTCITKQPALAVENLHNQIHDRPITAQYSAGRPITAQYSAQVSRTRLGSWADYIRFINIINPRRKTRKEQVKEAPAAPSLKAPTVTVPTVGRRMFELDDFDTAPRKAEPVKSMGDFQVVSSKRKPAKVVKTPPPGVERCSYGERCLFGTECARWHSPDDQEAFNRQKLPNGARKCPWGVKCFRKLKCINYHTEKDIEQFRRE